MPLPLHELPNSLSMKKLILLLTLTLAACSAAPKPYTEIQLRKDPEFTYVGQEEAFSGANLLARHGRELASNQLMPKNELSDADVRFCHRYVPLCTVKYATACAQCAFFSSADHTFVAVDTGYGSPPDADGNYGWPYYEWTFLEDGKKVFTVPMEYGSDGPIQRVEIVDRKPAVSFRRAVALPASNKEISKTTSDVFYNGVFFNEHFGVDGSHAVFTYGGKIGFIGMKNGKEFVYFDGKPVSKAFDVIRTSACCAAPMTELRVFDNGAFVFVGERDHYSILTEIDLNPFLQKEERNVSAAANKLLSDYRTAGACSDVLAGIGRKPDRLEFVKCEKSEGQVLFRAHYRVPGASAASVEDFFMNAFGMGPLNTTCCLWEPKAGKQGQIDLGNNVFLIISMNSGETTITDRTDWNKIPFFSVEVEIASV